MIPPFEMVFVRSVLVYVASLAVLLTVAAHTMPEWARAHLSPWQLWLVRAVSRLPRYAPVEIEMEMQDHHSHAPPSAADSLSLSVSSPRPLCDVSHAVATTHSDTSLSLPAGGLRSRLLPPSAFSLSTGGASGGGAAVGAVGAQLADGDRSAALATSDVPGGGAAAAAAAGQGETLPLSVSVSVSVSAAPPHSSPSEGTLPLPLPLPLLPAEPRVESAAGPPLPSSFPSPPRPPTAGAGSSSPATSSLASSLVSVAVGTALPAAMQSSKSKK